MTFRARLALLFAAVVSVLLVASGVGLVWLSRTASLDMVDRELMARARNFGRGMGPRGPRGPVPDLPGSRPALPPMGELAPRAIPPPGAEAEEQPEPLDAAVAQGRPLARPTFSTVLLQGSRVRVLTEPRPDGGIVQVGYNLADVERLARAQAGLLLLFVPVAVVVAALLGWFLADRAVRPVERVTEAAGSLGAENMGTRLPVSGDDEIAALARQFNQMVGRLETSFQQRDALLRQLRAALEAQRAFVADASHELRTPLARMKLLSSSALAQGADDAEMRDALGKVDAGADEMARLVSQLLTLARTDANSIPPGTSCALGDVVRRALEQAEAVGGPPVRCGEVPVVQVVGREDDLARALANLVENARRYAPESTEVAVSCGTEGGRVAVRVRDQGPGVAPEHLARLTDRFYRVEGSRARASGGTGLGLAIVKSVAEGCGGELRLESPPGEGLTATLLIPLADESPTKQLPNPTGI